MRVCTGVYVRRHVCVCFYVCPVGKKKGKLWEQQAGRCHFLPQCPGYKRKRERSPESALAMHESTRGTLVGSWTS